MVKPILWLLRPIEHIAGWIDLHVTHCRVMWICELCDLAFDYELDHNPELRAALAKLSDEALTDYRQGRTKPMFGDDPAVPKGMYELKALSPEEYERIRDEWRKVYEDELPPRYDDPL